MAYHGAEVGAGCEPEPGAAGGGAPEGRPESRYEMKALSRRHGDRGRAGRTMNRLGWSQRSSGGGRSRRKAALTLCRRGGKAGAEIQQMKLSEAKVQAEGIDSTRRRS